jgi:two-component system NtrC family sensor kinase
MNLSNIRIHRQFSDGLPPPGGDFHQLQQVFLNILNNAVDAIAEKGGKGEIWVRTDVTENRLRTEITDSGPGIQNTHRVFDPFYTTKPVGKGTGLGLSICYGIVKEHGGEIQVKNSPPRGAMFTILLPVLPTERMPEPTLPSIARGSVSGKVLLVDDEETVLQLELEVLRARGLTVRLTRSGREAMDLLLPEGVDAVVIDMKMEGEISALALYRWIEQNRPELSGRVVFTASNRQDDEASTLLRKAGCPVISKPFAIEQLWEAVRNVLAAEVPSPAKR